MSNQSYDPELPIHLIEPHPENPNRGDEKALEESIDELGWYGAIIVRDFPDAEGYQILGGEHRWRNTKSRGGDSIPAIVLHGVDDNDALKILLSDNEITRRGSYDNERLTKVLRALPSTRGTGFPARALETLERHETARKRAEEEGDGKTFEREYGILVQCGDEKAHERMFDRLIAAGIPFEDLKVVSI